MRIQEENCIIVPETPESFVYMLLDDDDEVVYVGQTRRGIVRPMEHKGSKEYSKIAILPCERKRLDLMESMLIEKYAPKHNKHHGRANTSLNSARNVIREYTGNESYSLVDLKRDIAALGIEPFVLDLKVSLRASNVQKIIEYRSAE